MTPLEALSPAHDPGSKRIGRGSRSNHSFINILLRCSVTVSALRVQKNDARSSATKRLSTSLTPPPGDRFSAYAPVVGVNLFDNHDRCLGIFSQDIPEQIRYTTDKLGFLLCRCSVFRDLDVHIGHVEASLFTVMHDEQSGRIYPRGSKYNTDGIGSHDPDKRSYPPAEGTADRCTYNEKNLVQGSENVLSVFRSFPWPAGLPSYGLYGSPDASLQGH